MPGLRRGGGRGRGTTARRRLARALLAAGVGFLRRARVRALFRESAWRRARLRGIGPVRLAAGIELDVAYAFWLQLRTRLLAEPPDEAFLPGRPGLPAIVPVPGIYERWDCLLPLLRRLNREGFPVRPVRSLGRMREPVGVLAARLAREVERLPEEEAVLLCHSKGGLVGRAAMLAAREPERIRRVIALATPFRGSTAALLVRHAPELRALWPASRQTVRLAAPTPFDDRMLSIVPRVDQAIARRNDLPGIREIRLPLIGHHLVMRDPRVLLCIVAELAETFGTRPPSREMRRAAGRPADRLGALLRGPVPGSRGLRSLRLRSFRLRSRGFRPRRPRPSGPPRRLRRLPAA